MKKILYFSFILSFGHLVSQVDLTSNLKVCMPMDGNANDLSGNSNNGVVSNATLTTDRNGAANKAYQFNRADNSHIYINNLSNLETNNELTISMWAKADAVTSNCLFVLDPDNDNDRCVGCAQYAASPTQMIWDYGDILSGGRSTIQNIPSDITNWHHYVYIISQTGNLKQTYLDGVNNLNTTYSLTCSNKNLPLSIGAGFSNGTNSLIQWGGKIDELIIYNRALKATEVSALFSGAKTCGMFTGIESLKLMENFSIYPSASVSGKFTINSDKIAPENRIDIYSMGGKLIKSYTGIIDQIDISEESQGIYLVKFVTNECNFSRKIIKE